MKRKSMRRFKEGDIVYTFLGENLVRLSVIAYLQDEIIVGRNEEGNLSVYEDSCYQEKHNAMMGMRIYLDYLESAYQEKENE